MLVAPSLKGGGAEKVVVTLLEGLQKMGQDVKLVLVLFDMESSDVFGQYIDVRYLNVRASGNIFYTILKFLKVIYRLTRIIRQESPCAILSFMDYANVVSIASGWLSRTKSRIVVSVHAPPTFQIGESAANLKERLAGMLAKRLYSRTDAIIAVSKGICSDLIQNFRVNKEQITIIHNPVDIDKISALSDEEVFESPYGEGLPIILSAGRLSKEKGFEYLLRAFSLIVERNDARLVILGEGKEETNLKKLSEELCIEKKVYFLGFKSNPYKYMKRSTIFVLASLYEGFGLVLVEAMACGVPVIATKSCGGIEEIIEHDMTGLLVPPGDEKALADAIKRLLGDEISRRGLGEAGRKRAEDFRADKVIKEYEGVIESVCAVSAER